MLPNIPDDWPLRAVSRFADVEGLTWHVQVLGAGPVVLLLHGTGASTHSWAPIARSLASRATVVVPDLPGHGFTAAWPGGPPALPAVARALTLLVEALALPRPTLVAGHSAGAALAVQLALDAADATRPRIAGFNPSLVPPPTAYTTLVAPWLAPLLATAPVRAVAHEAARSRAVVDRLLDSTASSLDDAQRAMYARLFRSGAHVDGALALMAGWRLDALLAACAPFPGRATFVRGTRDRWIPPAALTAVLAAHFPSAEALTWPGGHVLHEERPAEATALLERLLAAA